jgi:hypothetical protein
MLNLACKYDLRALKSASTERFVLSRAAAALKKKKSAKRKTTEEHGGDDDVIIRLIPDVPPLARELLGLPLGD